ncbi:MAG: 3-hydroxyisobutyrate dehydrogenase [Solirubrobacteraceae bacterium]|nr:3-hydroxyisobutyrate dehydrogenase [Solirubrobacteraceae bacterium]
MSASEPSRPMIAVLGTGRMGEPMARNLLAAGFRVAVWDRTPAHAAPLTADGARLADSPAGAATDADVVITMLADGAAVEEAMTSPFTGARSTIARGAVWVQMATVGIEWTDRLAALAAGSGLEFVDAPVSGSDGPAREGKLIVLASGPEPVRDRVQSIFDVLGQRTVWLGPAGNGTRLKLVLNSWLVSLTEAMAETLALTEALGLEPRQLFETIAGGPLAAPYALVKGKAMIAHDFEPGFALRHAVKDVRLALAAAEHGDVDLPVTAAVLRRWDRAMADGHADDDVASVIAEAVARP